MTDGAISKRRTAPLRIPSAADKWTFGALFVGGAGGLVWLKLHGYPQVEVTLLPVGIMLFYAAIACLTERFRLRADQIGDNCYYLGFLFTLTSLGFSLAQFHSDGLATEEIITNFGIALWTTILGLLLRVFFIQFRQNPVEIEREANLELAEASRRLRSELDTLTLDFNTYTRGLKQSVKEALTGTAESATKTLGETTEQFKTIAERVVTRLDEVFEAHAESAANLNKLSKRTANAFEAVIGRIETIEAPSDLITAKLEPLAAEIERIVRTLAAREEADRARIDNLETAIKQSLEGARQLDRRFESLSSLLGSLDQLGERIVKLKASLGDSVGSATQTISDHLKTVEGLRASAEDSFKRTTAAFEATLGAQEKALQSMGAKTEAQMEKLLAPLANLSRERAQEIESLGRVLGETVGSLKKHNQELEAELERSRRATLAVQEALAGMVDAITEQLGRGSGQPPLGSRA